MKSNLYQTLSNHLRGEDKFPHQSSGDFRPSEGTVKVITPYGPLVKGKCAREIYYRLSHTPRTNDEYYPNQIKRMKVGTLVENELATELSACGLLVGRSVKFSAIMCDVPVSGELDVVAKVSLDSDIRYCIECKSIYGYYAQKEIFGRFLKLGPEPGKPRDSYLMQIGFYLYKFSLLSKDDPSYLPFGVIYVCDRGDGHFGTFDVWLQEEKQTLGEDETRTVHRLVYASEHMTVPPTKTDYVMEDIFDRCRMILDHLKKGTPPPRDFIDKYDEQTLEMRKSQGLVSKTDYEKWKSSHGGRGKGAFNLGDWNCGYCSHKSFCQQDNRS